MTATLLVGAVAQPLGGFAFDRLGGRKVFLIATASMAVLIAAFAITSGAFSLIAIAGIAFFQFSLFSVALAHSSQLAPSARTGAATGVVFGVTGLMTAVAQPAVGALAELVGDIRVALAGQLPLVLVGIALAARITPQTSAALLARQ